MVEETFMYVTGFEADDASLLGGPLGGKVLAVVRAQMFQAVSKVIADSEMPAFVSDGIALRANCCFVAIAKDKSTLIEGMAQSRASVSVGGARAAQHFWVVRGHYGGTTMSVVGDKLNKLGASIVGHDVFSRHQLRTGLERNILKERGYFAIIMPQNIFGQNLNDLKHEDLGVMASVSFSAIARRINHGEDV
jgi:hypothetical protein